MKVALICLQLGVPGTLATTAFVTAFADGLAEQHTECHVFGLVSWQHGWGPAWRSQWDAEALGSVPSSTPWLFAARPTLADAREAAALGVLDRLDGVGAAAAVSRDWYRELLLERSLASFASEDELALVVYPISLDVIVTTTRIAHRRGWRLIVQSCESLSGSWIDPPTRHGYAQTVSAGADGVWALSEFLAAFWRGQGVDATRILVQPNVVRRSAFTRTAPPRTCSAVYLGNLEHAEIGDLLDVAEAVSGRLPDFRLSIYADATPERRRALAETLAARDLTRAVVLHEPVPPSRVPETLAQADVLLLPRAAGEFSQAGFPNKLGEYLASGRPVVVTRVGDIPVYLEDGVSALLVAPGDTGAFADAVGRLLADANLADAIGAEGAQVAVRLLASPVAAQRVLGFIAGLPAAAASGGRGAGLGAARLAKVAGDGMRRALVSLRRRASVLRQRSARD